jgi:hypothetical protein
VGNGFLLHSGIHDDLAELSLGNQLQGDRHFNGADQQFFNALFTQQFAELDQQAGISRPAVFEVVIVREVLPSRCFAPALHNVFVALVEGVLEVQQRDHQAGRQTGTTCDGNTCASD